MLKIESTAINFRLMSWYRRYKLCESCKKDMIKELIPVAWHPTRWWDWLMPEDEEREI